MKSSGSFDHTRKKTSASGGELPVTISDLREKEFGNKELTEEEARALENFDRYRLQYLKAAHSEKDFHQRYMRLQAKANLNSYREFL